MVQKKATTTTKAPVKKVAPKKVAAAATKKKVAVKKVAPKKAVTIATKKKTPVKKAPVKKAIVANNKSKIAAYKTKKGEKYMSAAMKKHFVAVLLLWREHLTDEMQKTFDHLKTKGETYADPMDRASQEEEKERTGICILDR